jgi:ParB-like chromosome segregation protein Spo0J
MNAIGRVRQTSSRLSNPMTQEKYQLLPELPPEQFAALKADIAERGVIVPVIVDEFGDIIDGHNRARACRELGKNDYPVEVRAGLSEEEKRALSRKLNALRRHLTRDQVRQIIADQIKETPAWANNRLAAVLGVDDKTVAAVRANLEATSEIPKLDKLTGTDGKARLRKQAKAKRPPVIVDHDDDPEDGEDEDNDTELKTSRPEYTEKEWDDLWAGKGKLAQMKQNAVRHAIALMEEGVPPDSPTIVALMKDASAATIESPGYNPFAGRTDEEKLHWHIFMMFLSYDGTAGRSGGEPQGVSSHVEWLLQCPTFRSVADWLGDEGDRFRQRNWYPRPIMPEQVKADWAAFLDQHRDWTLPEAIKKLESLQSEWVQAVASGSIKLNTKRKRRKGR